MTDANDAAAAYDATFYARQRAGSLRSAEVVAPIVMEAFSPASVVDVGCGVGTWLRAFADAGATRVLGYDGDYVDTSALAIPRERFRAVDLEGDFEVEGGFDLAVCLEVAEHLPDARAGHLVSKLTGAAPVVLFSAAVPGQGGTRHLNERWQDHWRGLFEARGFAPVDLVRPRVWRRPEVEFWYQQNTIVYCRRDALDARPDLRPVPPEVSLDVVHPRLYEMVRRDSALYLSRVLRVLPGLAVRAVARRVGWRPGGAAT